MLDKVYQGQVLHGLGNGKSKAFATVNLDPAILEMGLPQGVYAAWVVFANKKYKGALFYGPRKVLHEDAIVLEIYLLDFSQEIYGQTISFQLEKFIRPVKNFTSFASLKQQIALDIQAVTTCLID